MIELRWWQMSFALSLSGLPLAETYPVLRWDHPTHRVLDTEVVEGHIICVRTVAVKVECARGSRGWVTGVHRRQVSWIHHTTRFSKRAMFSR